MIDQQGSADFDVPDELICPITQEIFQDPVMNRYGHTYERDAILSWLAANGTCPLSRRPMKASEFIPNPLVESSVRLWMKDNNQERSEDRTRKTCMLGYFAVDFPSDEGSHRRTHASAASNHTTRRHRLRQVSPTQPRDDRTSSRGSRRLRVFGAANFLS